MHGEAYQFVKGIVGGYDFSDVWVLEIGSLNVNGSVRELFDNADYVGIDRRPGPGVDVVMDARDVRATGFDVVVCTEVLEHDPDPQSIIDCAERVLKPGGLLILTAGSNGREPHGADGGPLGPVEHYGNVEPEELERMLADWYEVEVAYVPSSCGVHASAKAPLRWECEF